MIKRAISDCNARSSQQSTPIGVNVALSRFHVVSLYIRESATFVPMSTVSLVMVVQSILWM